VLARAAASPAGRRIALPGAVLLALAAVFLVAWGTQPGTARVAPARGQTTAVTSVTRSCPPAAPGSTATQVTAVALPRPAVSGSGKAAGAAKQAGSTTQTGTATFTAVRAGSPSGAAAGARTPARQVSQPGAIATVTAASGGGTAVTATGAMAQGFEAEQSDASGTGLVSCAHPGSDLWFAGSGAAAGAPVIWLYLMNAGNVAATVNVTVLTDTGAQGGLGSAITVAPGQYAKKDIAALVGGSQALALHVQATTGQVTAGVWEGDGKSSGAWLPQAAAPSTSLVIPGLTVASSAARLFVVVPGAADARLKVVAYTPSGAVSQFPGQPVDASAGATTPVALSSLGASAAGLQLSSNVPVVAAVLVPGSGIGAFTTATAPVRQQGLVAGNPASAGVSVGLLLTAPAAAARVSVTVISADGTITRPAGDQGIAVKAGRTVAVGVSRPPGVRKPFAIVVTPAPGSGPLYAVRVVTAGTGGLAAPVSSLLPVPSALTSLTLPAARDAYQAVLP
jgi:hypothetical protein